MEKKDQDNSLFNSDISLKNDLKSDKIKTTDVNILLNRVRLDEKKNFNKKLILSASLVFLISLIAVFVII